VRLPATYTRKLGTRQYLAFYDLRQDKLWGYFSTRKRWMEVLQALKRMRVMYPADERIYLVLDNFSPHKRVEIKSWAKANKVSLVWTATNASWLNRIESQFTEMKEYTLSNSNYQSHKEIQDAIHKFERYRNKRNKKKKLKKSKTINLKRH
jgi:transposase